MTLSPDERANLVRLRLNNARETLEDARVLHERGSIRSAVNRAYYAMFYAASALALDQGQIFSKHKGLVAFIHKEFVKTGRLHVKHGRAFQKAFEDRSEGDYQDHLKLTGNDASEMVTAASDFIAPLHRFYRCARKARVLEHRTEIYPIVTRFEGAGS